MAAAPNIMTLFTTMYGYVETAIAGAVASFGSGLVSFVAAPLALAATIYFLLLGFAVLRGAIQAPLRELVFQAGKVGFALAAAGAVGYTTFVVNVATDLPGFQQLYDDRLATLPGVLRLSSTLVMKSVVENRPLPL